MRLCLGTVQFGMRYGIRGQRQPDLAQAVHMLYYAVEHGIGDIDTAYAYGTAEEVVGTFLRERGAGREKLSITSKLKPNILEHERPEAYYRVIKANLEESLARLHTDYLDGYYFHTPQYVFCEEAVEAMARLKREGYVKSAGVSAYEPEEVKQGLQNPLIERIQFPFSVFDQRMQREGIFAQRGAEQTILHTRSAFIQGLLFMSEAEVPPFLQEAVPILRSLDEVGEQYGYSRLELAMGYVKAQPGIECLVFGVDDIEQLKEDIAVFQKELPQEIVDVLGERFCSVKADIVMPSLWKLKKEM